MGGLGVVGLGCVGLGVGVWVVAKIRSEAVIG